VAKVAFGTLAATSSCTEEISNFVVISNHTFDILTTIRKIEQISLVVSSSDRANMAEIDRLVLSDHFHDTERRLYDLLQADVRHESCITPLENITSDSSSTSSLYKACCLTSIIYVAFALRKIPPSAGYLNVLVARLTTLIQGVDNVEACNLYPKTMLWILGTAGALSLGRTHKDWYVRQLADFCQDRKLYEWNSMREAFGSPMHLVPYFITELMELWNEVEEFNLMRGLE
jgi:hypothetical protein